jgi:hypothetical protein
MKVLHNTRKPKALGRYETRDELCREAWLMWLNSPRNISQIAKLCRVSETTIHTILNTKEGYPHGTA